MCVKEFFGYNCGHCSVPVLRQCPLSYANPHFPVCRIPAERPIYTNDFCHPCSRVVWNIKILKEEKEHRARHLRGVCLCDVVFDGEDRDKRLRPRSGKGKTKRNGKDIDRDEHRGKEGVADHGAFEQGKAEAEPGGTVDAQYDIEKNDGLKNGIMMVKFEEDPAHQTWVPAAQMAPYEYAGYYLNNGQNQGTDPEQSYAVAFGAYGYQLARGKMGGGMKWYPQEQYCTQLPRIPSASNVPTVIESAPRNPQDASSQNGRHEHAGPVTDDDVPKIAGYPIVVSSDMMRSESAGFDLW